MQHKLYLICLIARNFMRSTKSLMINYQEEEPPQLFLMYKHEVCAHSAAHHVYQGSWFICSVCERPCSSRDKQWKSFQHQTVSPNPVRCSAPPPGCQCDSLCVCKQLLSLSRTRNKKLSPGGRSHHISQWVPRPIFPMHVCVQCAGIWVWWSLSVWKCLAPWFWWWRPGTSPCPAGWKPVSPSLHSSTQQH